MSTPPSFKNDIAPMFDDGVSIDCMNNVPASQGHPIDLTSYDDVKKNASAILQKVSDGSMPMGQDPWLPSQIQTFQDWMDGGYQP